MSRRSSFSATRRLTEEFPHPLLPEIAIFKPVFLFDIPKLLPYFFQCVLCFYHSLIYRNNIAFRADCIYFAVHLLADKIELFSDTPVLPHILFKLLNVTS